MIDAELPQHLAPSVQLYMPVPTENPLPERGRQRLDGGSSSSRRCRVTLLWRARRATVPRKGSATDDGWTGPRSRRR